MINQVSFNQFTDAFTTMGRQDQFSYQAQLALYNYLTDLEEQCDISIELDVIALCCQYCEYDSLAALQGDYNDIHDLDHLRDLTEVIEFNGGSLIVSGF